MEYESKFVDPYTVQILLLIKKEEEVPRSKIGELRGEYQKILGRAEELVQEGFLEEKEPRYGSLKSVFLLTERGEKVAEYLEAARDEYIELKKD